jgi:hypothetical protein
MQPSIASDFIGQHQGTCMCASEICITFTTFTGTALDTQLVNCHDFRIFGYPEEKRGGHEEGKKTMNRENQMRRKSEARDKGLCAFLDRINALTDRRSFDLEGTA